jgi:KUP system potassium uptake protein
LSHQNTLLMQSSKEKWSLAGILVAVGIIYGDIGTSPLYVMQAIFNGEHKELINKDTVYGALSCIFWTLTLQTTFKYVLLILRADNNTKSG